MEAGVKLLPIFFPSCSVNKQFVAAVQANLEVTKGPSDEKWVQVFRGLFTGFQIKNISVETCVKDAEKTVANFENAFGAFEDREIYKGLHLIGYALTEVTAAMKDCDVEAVAIDGIEKFVKDLVSCIKGMHTELFASPITKLYYRISCKAWLHRWHYNKSGYFKIRYNQVS